MVTERLSKKNKQLRMLILPFQGRDICKHLQHFFFFLVGHRQRVCWRCHTRNRDERRRQHRHCVKVWLSLVFLRCWLSSCPLSTIDIATKVKLATKKELVVLATLIWAVRLLNVHAENLTSTGFKFNVRCTLLVIQYDPYFFTLLVKQLEDICSLVFF